MFNKKYSKIILASLLVFSFCLIARAAENSGIKLQVDIPGQEDAGKDLASYIAAWYTFGLGAVSVIAVVMIMWGGLLWLTAAGSGSQIGEAKKSISNAVMGLILALCSYGLLYIINPNLVKLKLPEIGIIQDKCSLLGKEKCESEPGCQLVDGKCIYIKEYTPPKTAAVECGFLGKDACSGQYNWGCWWTGIKCEVFPMCGLTRGDKENRTAPKDAKILCCRRKVSGSAADNCGFYVKGGCGFNEAVNCQWDGKNCVPKPAFYEYKYALTPLNKKCVDACGEGWGTGLVDWVCQENLGY